MYDFRFDTKLMQSFVGLQITSYKCTDTITEMVDIQIGDNVYCLTNEYEELDYFLLENENTVYRISDSYRNGPDNTQITVNVNQIISKVILLNEHIVLEKNDRISYDVWNTKAIIFGLNDYELCFIKEDCWFSEKIEILKGNNLLNHIFDEQGILDDFIDMKDGMVELNNEIVVFSWIHIIKWTPALVGIHFIMNSF